MFILKIVKYFIQAIIIYLFFIIIKIIGLTLSRKFFSFLFNKIGPLVKSEQVINNNLEKFLGSKNDEIKNEIKKKMWANYGKTFVEYLFLKKFKNNNFHIKFKGEEILEKIRNNNRPVVFVSGHFANFELMSMELVKRNIKIATVYRPLNNFFLNPFMEHLRKKYICKNQIKKGLAGVKESIKHVKNNFSIALMIDQRVTEGINSNFFTQKALTTTIPAQLVKKFKIPVVPIFIERIDNINFKIVVKKPIHFDNDISIKSITDELNLVLEKMIIYKPEQWIWSHNRWK